MSSWRWSAQRQSTEVQAEGAPEASLVPPQPATELKLPLRNCSKFCKMKAEMLLTGPKFPKELRIYWWKYCKCYPRARLLNAALQLRKLKNRKPWVHLLLFSQLSYIPKRCSCASATLPHPRPWQEQAASLEPLSILQAVPRTCRILVPRPGTEHGPRAVKAQS